MTIARLWTLFAALPVPLLTVVCAVAGAIGAVVAATISAFAGKLIVTPFLSARDKQDREVEWRKHASELTKLDMERKLKSGRDFTITPLRPSILDFLANYRDLQELGVRTPRDLYNDIVSKRMKVAPPAKAASGQAAVEASNANADKKPGFDDAIKIGSWVMVAAVLLTLSRSPRRRP